MRIGIFATGGTIAMRGPAGTALLPADGAAEIVDDVPLPPGVEIEHHDLFAKPSASISLADVQLIADRITDAFAEGFDGAVVTHGTDTLEETAFALSVILGRTAPVVVTGAMRSPDRAGADGPANLAAAIRVAADPSAAGQGVLILFGDEIHAAHLARKVHTSRPHAFSSEPFGPLGHVYEDEVRFELAARSLPPRMRLLGPVPVVPILLAGLDMEPETIETFDRAKIDGLVLAGVGGGHVASRAVPALERLARRIPVVITARVGMGRTLRSTYAYVGGDIDLLKRGTLNAGRWRPAQARILLQLALGQKPVPDLQELLRL